MGYHKKEHQAEGAEGRGCQDRPARVEGAVGTLVGAAHLADAEDVEGGGVEGLHEELLGSERLDEDSLSRAGQIRHREVPEKRQKKTYFKQCFGSGPFCPDPHRTFFLSLKPDPDWQKIIRIHTIRKIRIRFHEKTHKDSK